jgi:hypothetical protein
MSRYAGRKENISPWRVAFRCATFTSIVAQADGKLKKCREPQLTYIARRIGFRCIAAMADARTREPIRRAELA